MELAIGDSVVIKNQNRKVTMNKEGGAWVVSVFRNGKLATKWTFHKEEDAKAAYENAKNEKL